MDFVVLKHIRVNKIIFFAFCLIPVLGATQSVDSLAINKQQALVKYIIDRVSDLNEKGMQMSGDSVLVSEEFTRILNDETYRNIIYPETYTWEQAIIFIKIHELKKAFWFFINLYPENDNNKELVINSVINYDQLFKMDEIIVNTFNTYSFMDPEVSVIKDGKPEITRPDIFESKLKDVKEIVTYIKAYRAKQKETAK